LGRNDEVTTGTSDYPEIFLSAAMEARSTVALERIATALEQLVLAGIPSEHAAFNAANPPQTAPAPTEVHPWDNVPLPQTVAAALPYQPPVAVTTIQAPPPWVCPVHHTSKVVPAGVSKRTGATYKSFLSCTERDCPQKPPFA
jgi:hypothetical protein